MKIKVFDFPSFEEWDKTRGYSQKIGDYKCAIKTVAGGCNGNTMNGYEAVIANSDNPTNIFAHKLFVECIRCDVSDKNTLKEWYEAVIIKLNDEWKTFIFKTYIGMQETTDNNVIDTVKNELIELIGKNCNTCNTECCGGLQKACNRWSHIIS